MKTFGRTPASVAAGLLLLFCLPSASAWFFTPANQKNVVHAGGKPVDAACMTHGEAGDCQFYTCFEQRLPCGAEGYMRKFGTPYCSRFQQNLAAFTPQGQAFINGTARCLAQVLLPYYRQDSVNCHTLSHVAFDAVSSCYATNGFCDVLEDNAPLFTDIFQPQHLFQPGALKIWREILQVTYQCDPERINNFASSALRLLSGVVNFLTNP